MNLKKVFRILSTHNINEAECRYYSSTSLSLEVFKGELTNFSTNTSSGLSVDALINHKLVMLGTENLSIKGINNLAKQLLETEPYIEKADGEIYKEKVKYKKYNHFNKELMNVDIARKKALLFELEKKLKDASNLIKEVQVSYIEGTSKSEYLNTSGIKYKNKSNGYTVSTFILMQSNEGPKSHFESFEDNDFNKFNVDSFVSEVISHALKKLHPTQVQSNKYKVVFAPEVTTILLSSYISQLNAELILKNSSWFKDKINKEVANKKVTIIETPLKRDMFFSGIDDQGVPTKNQALIKKGILLTYLHNLETAKKFNVAPTGHAKAGGAKMVIAPHITYLKPGRLTKDELINKVNDGIYINELEGLHAGMNAQSGDFSLKASGFLIKEGKLSSPVDMITVTANLFEIFKNIKNISQNIEFIKNGYFAPCIYLNKISISC